MKVIVLGAGIIGVTSAYELAKAGHEVTVIDRQKGPALEPIAWGIAAPSKSEPSPT